MKENEFMIELLAELEKSKSKSKINKNIKEIEKAVNALRLTAILAKGDVDCQVKLTHFFI